MSEIDLQESKGTVEQRVLRIIAESQRLPLETVTIDKTFEELGIDSMDGVGILFSLENEFEISIPDDAARGIRTVREMVEGVEQAIAKGPAQPPQSPPTATAAVPSAES